MNVAELSGSLVRVALNRIGSGLFISDISQSPDHIFLFYNDPDDPQAMASITTGSFDFLLADPCRRANPLQD
jgi:hypothetical protein